jgi:hypothetical protein
MKRASFCGRLLQAYQYPTGRPGATRSVGRISQYRPLHRGRDAARWCRDAGASIHHRLRAEPWGQLTFVVRDPDDNLISFGSPMP